MLLRMMKSRTMSTPQTLSPKDQAAFAASTWGDEPYTLGPDSLARDDVPRGKISQHHWTSRHIDNYPSRIRKAPPKPQRDDSTRV